MPQLDNLVKMKILKEAVREHPFLMRRGRVCVCVKETRVEQRLGSLFMRTLRFLRAQSCSSCCTVFSILVSSLEWLPQDGKLTLNVKYSYKKLKIKIDQPVKSEVKAEAEATHDLAMKDRELVMEACIVRIMKMRKRLVHTALVQEVIDQLKSRFKPDVVMIKVGFCARVCVCL